jgi:hypothetical protein
MELINLGTSPILFSKNGEEEAMLGVKAVIQVLFKRLGEYNALLL